jgi:hypothetical protein
VRIGNNDFGPMLKRLLQRFVYVPCLGHHFHIRFIV